MKTDELIHSGKLHWASLLNLLPEDFLIPSQKKSQDPYSFGWQLRDQSTPIYIKFERMLYATAESAVALATFTDKMRSNSSKVCDVIFGEKLQDWVKALQLDQISNNKWQEKRGWTTPSDCYAYPLQQLELSNEEDPETYARDLVMMIRSLPDEIIGENKDDLLSSVYRVAYEAFLNIYEHAYEPDKKKIIYVCATVTPAGHFDNKASSTKQFASLKEVAWLFESQGGLILEIAIADVGNGIPTTLWRNAVEKNRPFTADWTEKGMSIISRASAHQNLCDYAFNYASTRKTDKEFTSRTFCK